MKGAELMFFHTRTDYKTLKNPLSAVGIFFFLSVMMTGTALAADSALPRYEGKTREEFRENMKESVKEMKRFSEDFQRFITDIKEATKDAGWNDLNAASSGSIGSADIVDQGNVMNVMVDLPGVQKQDITAELTDDQTIRISAKRMIRTESQDKLELNERYDGQIDREVKLPARADLTKKIKAKLKDGVLSIQIPKANTPENKIVSIDVD